MAFPGVRSAVKAMAEGGMTEQQAYNEEERRLTAARSASALMDKRVSDANMANRKDLAGGKLQDLLDPADPMSAAILAELAGQMNSAASAKATNQEVEFQGDLIERFRKNPESVTPELANMYQAIAGRGSMLTGSNVNPTKDSQLDQERITAMTNASNRSNPKDKPEKYSAVTDTQMLMALGDDPAEFGRYYSWLGKRSMNDPTARHNAVTLARYVHERDKKALSELTGVVAPEVVPAVTDPTTLEGWDDLSLEEQKEVTAWLKANPEAK